MVADGVLDRDQLNQPMVEPEVAFELHHELRGPGITTDDIRRATLDVQPCMEIIDSRITNWQIGLCNTIADNGSSARVVYRSESIPIGDLDLSKLKVSFRRNDDEPLLGGRGCRAGRSDRLRRLAGQRHRALRIDHHSHQGRRRRLVHRSLPLLGDVSCRFRGATP